MHSFASATPLENPGRGAFIRERAMSVKTLYRGMAEFEVALK
jgi:hypothetical protein